jgi:transposase
MQNQFVDLYRNGIKTAADLARLSLENTVRLQEQQLGIVRNILEENTRSAERVTHAHSMEELLALQSQLAGAQLQRVAEFWSSLWQATVETQKTWIGQAQSQARTSEEVAREAANQISRAAGSVRESGSAAHRKSA